MKVGEKDEVVAVSAVRKLAFNCGMYMFIHIVKHTIQRYKVFSVVNIILFLFLLN
jgi:hypothetical protein